MFSQRIVAFACLFLALVLPQAAADPQPNASCYLEERGIGDVLFGNVDCVFGTWEYAWPTALGATQDSLDTAYGAVEDAPETAGETYATAAAGVQSIREEAVPCYHEVVVELVDSCAAPGFSDSPEVELLRDTFGLALDTADDAAALLPLPTGSPACGVVVPCP